MPGRNLENQQRAAASLTTTGSCPLCSNAPHEHQDNADEEEDYEDSFTQCLFHSLKTFAVISQLSSREDPLELVPESNDWINELWE